MQNRPEPDSPEDIALRTQLLERLKSDPDGYEANRDFALYCSDKRNFVMLAEPHLLKALGHNRMDGHTIPMMAHLATIFQYSGRFEMAARSYALLHQLAPDNSEFLRELGHVHYRMGRIDEASEFYRQDEEMLAARARRTAERLNEPVRRLIAPANALCAYIGELASLADLLVKARGLGWLGEFEPILLADPDTVVNPCFLDYWRPHLTIVSDVAGIRECREKYGDAPMDLNVFPVGDGRFLNRDLAYPLATKAWREAGHAPVLSLSAEHHAKGWDDLRERGIPDGAWFATLHVREQGFFREDERTGHNKFRCADIETFFPAIEAVTRRGGWVVRIGDPSMTPLPAMPQVLDYAHAERRSDWMDIFLMAGCRLYVGMPSGPWDVAKVFGVPVVATNWFPMGGWPALGKTLFIHKLVRQADTRQPLPLKDIIKPPFYRTASSHIYDQHGLEVVDNTAEEIENAVVEMLDRLDGAFDCSEDDEKRQALFRSCGDYYGLDAFSPPACDFLRRHPELFDEVDAR